MDLETEIVELLKQIAKAHELKETALKKRLLSNFVKKLTQLEKTKPNRATAIKRNYEKWIDIEAAKRTLMRKRTKEVEAIETKEGKKKRRKRRRV